MSAQTEFRNLRDNHLEYLEVHWWFELRQSGVHFSSFQRNSDAPKGNGAKALKEFLEVADKYALPVHLYAQDRSDNGRLLEYYRQFGFEVTEETGTHWKPMQRKATAQSMAA